MTSVPYDVIVIGAGPAGLSAATEAARAGLRTLCLDKLAPGGVLINLGQLHDVEPPSDGPQFASQLADQAMAAGVEIGFGDVVRLSRNGLWTVEMAEGEQHAARVIVVATGLDKGRLGVPGEEDYEGRGLSHCAICDGPLYAGEPVVVAGAGGWAAHEAEELKAFASEITIVDPTAGAPVDGITHIEGRIVGLEGNEGLQAIVVESSSGRKTVPTSAVFVYVGQAPAAKFLPDSLARDAAGHIVADDEGRTSAAAAFAAGDVRAGAHQSVAAAIADGQRAGRAAAAALAKI
jgi:thioredoxin reductase (NADPH)